MVRSVRRAGGGGRELRGGDHGAVSPPADLSVYHMT